MNQATAEREKEIDRMKSDMCVLLLECLNKFLILEEICSHFEIINEPIDTIRID